MQTRCAHSVLLLVSCLSVASVTEVQGQETGRVLNEIFNDDHIIEAAMDIHFRWSDLPPSQRFELLKRWVLPEVFEHEFGLGDFASHKFVVTAGTPGVHLIETKNGIAAMREGGTSYRSSMFSPRLSIQGDFDITTTYDQFESEPVAGGNSTLMLIANVEGGSQTFVQRVHTQNIRKVHQHIAQSCVVEKRREGERRDYFATVTTEARSGRIRLARRGSRVYYLCSEGDSPNYQLLGSREFTKDPLRADGLTLLCQSCGAGLTRVIWKKISVRAESLSGLAIDNVNQKIAELDRTKAQLTKLASIELTTGVICPRGMPMTKAAT